VDRPRTQYARSGGYSIAYQVVGEGPIDLVYVPGWVSHLDLYWEEPSVARFFGKLASFARLIVFDKRGIGLSDPVAASAMPTLEERMDDVRAVLDAVGSERAAVLGQGYGSPIASLFSASYCAQEATAQGEDDASHAPQAAGLCDGRSLVDGGLH
jgi:pimeloyl-ACP methyl ester carboxylesterase